MRNDYGDDDDDDDWIVVLKELYFSVYSQLRNHILFSDN